MNVATVGVIVMAVWMMVGRVTAVTSVIELSSCGSSINSNIKMAMETSIIGSLCIHKTMVKINLMPLLCK